MRAMHASKRSWVSALALTLCFSGLGWLSGCTEGLGANLEPLTPKSEGESTAAAATPVPDLPVYPTADPPKPCEVVGVLDFHTDATSEDKGFDELRREAARLGADAVISAEFEHGEEGEKSHLSGVAIRWKTPDDRPFVELGPIDIATPEDADDKGFEAMRAQARAMGADKIVNVHFEHGAEGAMSHLTGTAVRYVKSGGS